MNMKFPKHSCISFSISAAAVFFVLLFDRINFNKFLRTTARTTAVGNVTIDSYTTAGVDKGINYPAATVGADTNTNTTAGDHKGVDDAPATVNNTGTGPSSSSLLLPLRPPFKIVQFGIPRTGSSFQSALLDAIIRMKSPNSTTIEMMHNSEHLNPNDPPSSFIARVHFLKKNPNLMQIAPDVSFFTSVPSHDSVPGRMSGESFPYPVVYSQSREDLLNCSLCEVERYVPIFDLTEDEVRILRTYMEGYQVVRRCCGFQMSKYEMARLHGCDVSEYRSLPEYPGCEDINKTEAEERFANNPAGIRLREVHPEFNWEKVGDCRRMNVMIRKGLGFNRRKFPGCDKELN